MVACGGEAPSKLTAFTLKATGIDGLSADVSADIDEANSTITLSINADPTKRATWTAISTNQITTTYAGIRITPSATTLNLSSNNNNVATYTVTNADGKTKVYTLKVEFASFKVNIDQNGLEGVSTYEVEVYYKNSFSINDGAIHTIQVSTIPEQNISQKTYTYSDYLATGTTTYAVLYFKNAQGETLSERLVEIQPVSSAKTVSISAPVLTQNYLLAYIGIPNPQQRTDNNAPSIVMQEDRSLDGWNTIWYLNVGGPSTSGVSIEYAEPFWTVQKMRDNYYPRIRARWLGRSPLITVYPDGDKVMDFSVHKVNKLSFNLNR